MILPKKKKVTREEAVIKEKKKKSGFMKSIYPYITVSEAFDDNIYEYDLDKQFDFITTVDVGLVYDHTSAKKGDNKGVRIKGGAKMIGYAIKGEYNQASPIVKISANEWPARGIEGYFDLEKLQEAGRNISTQAIDTIVDYWRNAYGVSLSPGRENWNKDSIYWDLDYSHSQTYYKVESFNYRFDGISADLYFKMPRRKKLLIGYDCQYTEYPKRFKSGQVYNAFWAGFIGEIFRDINGLVRFGYGLWNPEEGRNAMGFTANINLNYQMSKTLLWTLTASKINEESTNVDGGRSDVSTAGLGFFKKLSPRQSLNAGFSYQYFDYASDRKDKTINGNIAMTYDLRKWLKLICGYKVTWNSSNEIIYKYHENVAEVKLTTEF
ncbi:outer membrane beta-barrel protein [Candidatus Omnitrophota bacterium]